LFYPSNTRLIHLNKNKNKNEIKSTIKNEIKRNKNKQTERMETIEKIKIFGAIEIN
jgi:hypothetical protein